MDEEGEWTVAEVAQHLALTREERDEGERHAQWRTIFREGVTFDADRALGKLDRPAFAMRHDVNFLTPSGRAVRCKVRRESCNEIWLYTSVWLPWYQLLMDPLTGVMTSDYGWTLGWTSNMVNLPSRFLCPWFTKVWVRHEDRLDSGDRDEIPFNDIKNILAVVDFKNEQTKARCQGWLCLASTKKLKADIIFPAFDFDCRLTLRKSEWDIWSL